MSWIMFVKGMAVGALLGIVVTGYLFIYLFLERTR